MADKTNPKFSRAVSGYNRLFLTVDGAEELATKLLTTVERYRRGEREGNVNPGDPVNAFEYVDNMDVILFEDDNIETMVALYATICSRELSKMLAELGGVDVDNIQRRSAQAPSPN